MKDTNPDNQQPDKLPDELDKIMSMGVFYSQRESARKRLLAWRDKAVREAVTKTRKEIDETCRLARLDELRMMGFKDGEVYSLYSQPGKLLTREDRIKALESEGKNDE